MGWIGLGKWLLATLVAIAMMSMGPAPALAAPAEKPLLTVEILTQRVQQPVRQDGRMTINLRGFEIDLRQEEFQREFYRLLQTKLQSGSLPVALDLSDALVEGDVDLQRLGLREPLYGDALFPMLSDAAQAQLKRDRKRLSQLSQLSRSLLIQTDSAAQQIYLIRGPLVWVQTHFTGRILGGDTFFLDRILAQGSRFDQGLYLAGSRFNQPVRFSGAWFDGDVQLRNTLFFDRVRFDQSQFRADVTFQGAEFQGDAVFNGTVFEQGASFNRVQWQDNVDFASTQWQSGANFFRDSFAKALFFTEARFDGPLMLRQARFSEPINFRNGTLLAQADFGDATFFKDAYINISGLEFNPDQGEILGSPGRIGRQFSVPSLAGNETLLRNLARNFRLLEQIADANQVEYTTERLRLGEYWRRLTGINLNTATLDTLEKIGFSATQAAAIATQRQIQPFLSSEDLLAVEGIDLAAYVKVRDRIITRRPLTVLGRIQLTLRWLWLSGLIVLSHYGTSLGLIFGCGLMAIALFTLMVWFVDRYRRRLPTPIVPPAEEAIWMAASTTGLGLIGLSIVVRIANFPFWSLLWLGMITLPVPALLIGRLLQRGRYHDLMAESYLVEDGSLRQLRLLIARLPVIPKFPFFRDRYTPISWDRRWNWLNYYDFSFNNWLKFGFNDIRLRDQHLPGLITGLVWYQWGLGLLYVALLLWTLSRTIPGLNLLIYF
ncbi:hypothetical protein C7271_04350 [filamentous cyanobacterium CCP5]|nr:hypothetical protein C7271_04350 [filamentous cyanobacterium CCP5]